MPAGMVRRYSRHPSKVVRGGKGLNKTEKKQATQIAKRVVNSMSENKVLQHPRVTDLEITATTPYLYDFLNVVQGTADNTREGDEILFKHLLVNMDITGSQSGAVKTGLPVDRVRVMLIKWKEPDFVNGVANNPTGLNIFGTNLPLGTNLFTAMPNHEENGRKFQILYDKKITLCGDITNMVACDSPERKQTRLSIKVNAKKYGNKKVRYDNINPSQNIHMNGLYLFVFTDNAGGLTQSGPTLSIDSRLIYKDF